MPILLEPGEMPDLKPGEAWLAWPEIEVEGRKVMLILRNVTTRKDLDQRTEIRCNQIQYQGKATYVYWRWRSFSGRVTSGKKMIELIESGGN